MGVRIAKHESWTFYIRFNKKMFLGNKDPTVREKCPVIWGVSIHLCFGGISLGVGNYLIELKNDPHYTLRGWDSIHYFSM